MTQRDLQDIKNKLTLYILRYPNKNNTKLAELFLEENTDVPLSVRSIRRYISLITEADDGLNEDIDIEEKDVYAGTFPDYDDLFEEQYKEEEDSLEDTINRFNEVNNGLEVTIPYMFELKYSGTDYSLDRKLVDQVICAYSKHGLNLTSGTIQRILGIDSNVFKAIIYRLNISKESDPYSEYSKENLSETDLYNELSINIEYLLDRLFQNDGTTAGKLAKVHKKAILLEQHSDLKFRTLVSGIKELLPDVTISKYTPLISDIESKSVHLFIPDMHIGLNQNNYNIDIIRDKLNNISEHINSFDEKTHVHFMGDIIHSVSGLNHRDSWKDMKQGTTGAEAIIQPYKLLLEFLTNINSLYKVNFVGGNHGRMASNKAEENTAEAEKLIAFMIKESIEVQYLERDLISINFDSYRIVDDEDPNMTVILLHGDKPIDKASGQSIAWEYGNPSKFNYIAVAHMHSRKQDPKDDGLKFRKEQLPAFCPADTYGKTVAHESMPGYKIIKASSNKVPLVIDIPLYYD